MGKLLAVFASHCILKYTFKSIVDFWEIMSLIAHSNKNVMFKFIIRSTGTYE